MFCKECGTENKKEKIKCSNCNTVLNSVNSALNSSDTTKIFLFIVILLATVGLLGFGVLPLIFLYFGISMMKKNQDFGYIQNSVTFIKTYFLLVSLTVIVGSSIAWLLEEMPIQRFLVLTSISIVSLPVLFILTNLLFFKPLFAHRKWVEVNGIFITKTDEKETEKAVDENRLNTPSITNDLIKLSNLLSKGFITQEEFKKAKVKILN